MLELSELRKRFGDVVALDGVSFAVTPGSITGFVGRNGAGKSTTMRSIFDLVNLDGGTLRWQGSPIDAAAMARFGFMPEQRGLYRKMKIADQVSWFAQLKGMTASRADEAARRLLTDLGLEERLGDKLEDLSHGNQQRVQLAVSLAHDPDLCVLDEPFNGLDPSAVQVLNRQLRRLAEDGKAVLFSSHQLDLVEELCDDLVIIEAGRIRAIGSVTEVRRSLGFQTVELGYEAAPDWTELNAVGATVTGTRTGTIRLDDGDDLDHLLTVARKAGPLHRFSYDLPPLATVFDEVTR